MWPPIPPSALSSPLSLDEDQSIRLLKPTLTREGAELVLQAGLSLRQWHTGEYLEVHWYDGARVLGSESIYVDSTTERLRMVWQDENPRAYRAVLLLRGKIIRQLELYETEP